MIVRRQLLTAAGAGLIGSACRAQPAPGALTPEQFGAKGDGHTNDTAAFAALAAEIMRRGGGEIVLRPVVYLVGQQRDTRGGAAWFSAPQPILSLTDLTRPLRIAGNGATLRCAPGLRYGAFDPATGQALTGDGGNLDRRTVASPYQWMIAVERARAAVQIEGLTLDGNSAQLRLGGSYGDTGIQVAAGGILLHDNRGDEILRDIRCIDHGQDGLLINGLNDPPAGTRRLAQQLQLIRNGRQGCSIVGGRSWRFEDCRFERTGRGAVASAPASGVDIEAEGTKRNRDHIFVNCSFVDNVGAGLVADSGDSAGVLCTRCRFVGTTAPAIWPNRPGFHFDDCRITGTVVACFGDSDPSRATLFTNTLFSDDPALSPTRAVYRQGRTDGALVDLAQTQGVTFDRCRFLAVGGATLPWSIGAIYRDCTMRQTGRSPSFPRGTYLGTTAITGPVDLNGARFEGPTTVNGVRRR